DAPALKGALTGTAGPGGRLDLGAASAAEGVGEPGTLTFGNARGRRWSGATLDPGGAAPIFRAGRLPYLPPGKRAVTEALELRAGGGQPVKVPWTVTFGPQPRGLLGSVRLSVTEVRPSD